MYIYIHTLCNGNPVQKYDNIFEKVGTLYCRATPLAKITIRYKKFAILGFITVSKHVNAASPKAVFLICSLYWP